MVNRIVSKGDNDDVKMTLVKELGLSNLTFLLDMRVKEMIEWLRGENYIDYVSQDINSVYEYVKYEGHRKGIRKVRKSIRRDNDVILTNKIDYQEYVLSQLEDLNVYRVEFDDNYLNKKRKDVKVIKGAMSNIKRWNIRYDNYKIRRYNKELDRYNYRVRMYIVVLEDKEGDKKDDKVYENGS